jgi:hypothetical protein
LAGKTDVAGAAGVDDAALLGAQKAVIAENAMTDAEIYLRQRERSVGNFNSLFFIHIKAQGRIHRDSRDDNEEFALRRAQALCELRDAQ